MLWSVGKFMATHRRRSKYAISASIYQSVERRAASVSERSTDKAAQHGRIGVYRVAAT